MLKSLFSSVDRIITVALVVVVLGMVYSNNQIKSQLEQSQARAEQIKSNLKEVEKQSDYLQDSLNLADQQNQKLISERELLEKLSTKQSKVIREIESALSKTQTQLANLRLSNDSNTKDWANSCIPGSVIGMLKYATAGACNKDSRQDPIQIRNHAGPIHSSLHDGKVHADRQRITGSVRSEVGSGLE